MMAAKQLEWKQRNVVKFDGGNIAPLILRTHPSKIMQGSCRKAVFKSHIELAKLLGIRFLNLV